MDDNIKNYYIIKNNIKLIEVCNNLELDIIQRSLKYENKNVRTVALINSNLHNSNQIIFTDKFIKNHDNFQFEVEITLKLKYNLHIRIKNLTTNVTLHTSYTVYKKYIHSCNYILIDFILFSYKSLLRTHDFERKVQYLEIKKDELINLLNINKRYEENKEKIYAIQRIMKDAIFNVDNEESLSLIEP